MRVFLPRLTLAVSIALIGPTASAAQESLTLEQALERAREGSPSVLAARARIEEARARLAGASLLLRENPELEAAAGGRSSAENNTEMQRGSTSAFFRIRLFRFFLNTERRERKEHKRLIRIWPGMPLNSTL